MKVSTLLICIVVLLGAVCLFALQEKNNSASAFAKSVFTNSSKSLTTLNTPASAASLFDIPLPQPLVNPRIVVSKSKRELTLYSDDKVLRRYRVALGLNPRDDKIREGDHCTPEGEFYIFTKNEKSAYYLSLGLSYPNIEDAERGLRDKLITRQQYQQIVRAIGRHSAPPQNTALGGDIYIHGGGTANDWTWGCVALSNDDIRELFNAVPKGTTVIIEH
jgi:lipoprotein-anchoring transpeptidase ErfK/SrfK